MDFHIVLLRVFMFLVNLQGVNHSVFAFKRILVAFARKCWHLACFHSAVYQVYVGPIFYLNWSNNFFIELRRSSVSLYA